MKVSNATASFLVLPFCPDRIHAEEFESFQCTAMTGTQGYILKNSECIIKGSLVEKLPSYEDSKKAITAQSSNSSVTAQ